MMRPDTIVIGFQANPYLMLSWMDENGPFTHEDTIPFLSRKNEPEGLIFLALKQYLEQKFKNVTIFLTIEPEHMFPNGTWLGLTGNINRSEVDVGNRNIVFKEDYRSAVDFSYPSKLVDYTFITEPPEYVPSIFGIFRTFNLSVWLTLVAVLMTLSILHYFISKLKFNLCETSLHSFAVLMKQSALLIPSSFAEKVLFCSWVVGAMILCLSYESAFLSFLSIPPVTKIKHFTDLASAIKKGDIRCLAIPQQSISLKLMNSNLEDLRAIAHHMRETSADSVTATLRFEKFTVVNKRSDIAFITHSDLSSVYAKHNFFVSEDKIFMEMAQTPMRKDFCCKELIDTFVHRMAASGIENRYYDDSFFGLSRLTKYFLKELPKRKLTLTDVAPAFIFLLWGHFIALVVFFYEIISNRKNARGLKVATIEKRENLV